jgi:hypothetical protein
MEDSIKEFIDIMTDNHFIVKRYKFGSNSFNDSQFDNTEFDEKLLLSKNEFNIDDFLEFMESKLFRADGIFSFELNGYNHSKGLENFLESEFEKFRIFIVNNFNENEKSSLKEIVERIKPSRNELDFLRHANIRSRFLGYKSLASIKVEFCAETIRFINNHQLFMLSNPINKKKAKPQKVYGNLTKFNQNQIVILFHYLREKEFIGIGMQKNSFADFISGLTGFAAEKIRQDLSHIDKKSNSTDRDDFLESDYNAVRRGLDKVIASIKEVLEEKFLFKP